MDMTGEQMLESSRTLDLRRLDEKVWTSPQITVEDVAVIARLGFTLIVNNRPDGEESSQPDGDLVKAAAEREGLDYIAIPVDHSGFFELQMVALSTAIRKAEGKVLTYCRTGTRCTFLWSLAAASRGKDPAAIMAAAQAAGYDVSIIAESLEELSRKPVRGRRSD